MDTARSDAKALVSITAVGGGDGRRPLLMGAVAQAGVGFLYAPLDRWVALHDHRALGKPVRLRDPRADTIDEAGEVLREGRVDVLARLHEDGLVLYHGREIGRPILGRADVARREVYAVAPTEFGRFAEACRLTAMNERALARLVAEIAQARRAPDPASMVVNVDL